MLLIIYLKQGHQSTLYSGSKGYYYKVVNIKCGKTIRIYNL